MNILVEQAYTELCAGNEGEFFVETRDGIYPVTKIEYTHPEALGYRVYYKRLISSLNSTDTNFQNEKNVLLIASDSLICTNFSSLYGYNPASETKSAEMQLEEARQTLAGLRDTVNNPSHSELHPAIKEKMLETYKRAIEAFEEYIAWREEMAAPSDKREDYEESCGRCGGLGDILIMGDWFTCTYCNGNGSIPIQPSEDDNEGFPKKFNEGDAVIVEDRGEWVSGKYLNFEPEFQVHEVMVGDELWVGMCAEIDYDDTPAKHSCHLCNGNGTVPVQTCFESTIPCPECKSTEEM